MSEKPISPLRQRMIEDMSVRNFGEKTRNDYIRHVRTFTAFLGRSPDTATAEDLRRFQLHQSKTGVRPPTINGSVAALRFFFTVTLGRANVARHLTLVREPRKMPLVLSLDEIARLLEAAPGPKYKAALSAAYGAGLRVSEVVALKVSDVDSKRMLLRIEQGKGQKDRFAMLSPVLLDLLRDWYRIARPAVWLFPGRDRLLPLTTRQFNRVVHAAAEILAWACQGRHDRTLCARGHQHHPRGHEPIGSPHSAASEQERAAGIIAGGHVPSCSGSRGHLPRLRCGVAYCQCRLREPRRAQGDERHRELPHGRSRWPGHAL